MIAYVKNCRNWQTKDILEYEEYTVTDEIDFSGKTTLKVAKKPNIVNDDFVIMMDGDRIIFFGICENFSSSNDTEYDIQLKQFETLFDREVFTGGESVISSTGIEDYISAKISANWISSGDTMMDMSFMTATATTHTPKDYQIEADAQVLNLKDFISSIRLLYGVSIAPSVTDQALTLSIKKDSAAAMPIDVTVTDVSGYDEVYSVKALAKLLMKWKNTDTEAVSTVAYYLKTDRTITTSAADPDRSAGSVKSSYMEAASIEEVNEAAANEFQSNAYEHKITFGLQNGSYAYPVADYYVGRKATIKTKTGIQDSLITGMSYGSGTAVTTFVFGALKVSLIDKLKDLRRNEK